MLVNTEMGKLDANKNGLVPGDFRTDFETNYTMSIELANFEKSMVLTLYLPKEIDFGDENPVCTGLTGNNDVLKCDTDRKAKTLTFRNTFNFFEANPGAI